MTTNTETPASSPTPVGRPQPKTSKVGRFARAHAFQIGILVVAAFVWILFFIGSPRTFSSFPIYQSFMSTTPFFAIMALPLTLVIIAKEIDLSFPAIMSFGMLAFSSVLAATGNVAFAFIGLLAAGFLAGAINGLLVVRVGIPALVATIGTSFFWRGVVLVITGGNGASLVPTTTTFLHPLLVGRLFGKIPMQFVWTLVIAGALWVLLNRTKSGAHVYLVGDNEDSAKLMGVSVARTKMMVFILMGLQRLLPGWWCPWRSCITGRRWAKATCSTPSPRFSWAAHRSSAAPALSSARWWRRSSSALSTPVSWPPAWPASGRS